MSENEVATAPLTHIPLDPTKWAEPKEFFVGKLTKCRYATTDDAKARSGADAGRTFTEIRNWPRAGQTWETEVERMDAIYVNKQTGEEAGFVKRYQTIDLERYDERKKAMVPVTQGNNKANYIIGAWVKAGARLHPSPEENEGFVAEWCLERSHNFGGGQPAKNLLYPVRILAKPGVDYEFRGEVDRIEFDPQNQGSGVSLDDAAGSVNAAASPSQQKTSKTVDHAAIDAMLVGLAADADLTDLVTENKGAFSGADKTALLTGTYVEKALEDGRLVVAPDGTLTLKE